MTMSNESSEPSRGRYDRRNYVRTSRLFYMDAAENVFDGWYFKVRGPRYVGPFPSEHEASRELGRMISKYCAHNDSSGR